MMAWILMLLHQLPVWASWTVFTMLHELAKRQYREGHLFTMWGHPRFLNPSWEPTTHRARPLVACRRALLRVLRLGDSGILSG